MDDLDVIDADVIDEALPAPPALPAGVPSLARHLAWALGHIRAFAKFTGMIIDDGPYQEALAALEALPTVPTGTVEVEGRTMWPDDRGALLPEAIVRAQDRLTDEVVRTIATGALGVSGILARYRERSLAEVYDLLALLAQEYQVDRTGRASVSLTTVDGRWRVQVVSAERISFGPQLDAARQLLQQYLAEQQAPDELKALISNAFGLDRAGGVRAAEILRLRRYEIGHPKWQAAMRAITDAMQVSAMREYLRVYRRDETGEWRQVPLDVASA